ncbi:MAG TPA: NAD-dependent succinate-semialdehyde dehydrogenase [Longimicrobiales bacterium]|nr:NAD-dependent succinate-semialdehyde dehydrogenase [Longimicrobiales bacterium]
MAIISCNPATGQTLRTFEPLADAALTDTLDRAAGAFEAHRRASMDVRAAAMRRAAGILEADKHEFARIMTLEMGKPIGAAVAEVEKCAWVCRYYADHASAFLADESVDTGRPASFIRYQPLGIVLAIMPWNFPFWQVFRFLAPGLMAGNVGLLKHASSVPQCALAIEDIVRRAGFTDHVFQALLIDTDRVADIIAHPHVRAVTLTGSDGAGAAVAATAGRELKKTVLELGGSDPFIVMPSADLDAAISTAVTARTINNGQSCIAAKRFIVAEAIYDEFRERFTRTMAALRMGDPLDPATELGPLATRAIRDELHEQVRNSVDAGAALLTGGTVPDGDGWFYPPTVLDDIPEQAPAFREELFGPVASLFRVADVDDAIALANDSVYGLGSAAWTRDENEKARFIEGIEAGIVTINGMVASDPRLPFGGIRRSGYGRELGRAGILEFVNIKTVMVEA